MKLKVHYIKDEQGNNKSVKLDIEDWKRLQKLVEKASNIENEAIEFIKTPVEIPKIKAKPKSRHFSDFIMDI